MFRIFALLLVIVFYANNLFGQIFASGYYNNFSWNKSQGAWRVNDNVYEEYDENGNLLIYRKISNLGVILNEIIYTYNSSNHKVTELHKVISNGNLINFTNYIYTYHSNDELSYLLSQNWDTLSNQWINNTLVSISYNDKNLKTEYKLEAFSNTSIILLNKEEYIHTYNTNNLLSTYVYVTDIVASNTYKSDTVRKTIYKYDTNNRLIEKIDEYKDNAFGFWVKQERFELFYQNDKVYTAIFYYGNQVADKWQESFKLDSIIWKTWTGDYFNTSNIQISHVRYEWSYTANKFVFDEEYHRVYYFNTPSFDEYYLTDSDNDNIRDTTTVHTELYDENNNIVLDVDFSYSKGGTKYPFYGNRFIYVYSQNKKITDFVLQSYSPAINNFENLNRKLLKTATSINNENSKLPIFKVYPNPSAGKINIELFDSNFEDEILCIYDVNGKLIQEQIIPALTKNLTIENLEEGVYIIRVGNTTSKVLIIKK